MRVERQNVFTSSNKLYLRQAPHTKPREDLRVPLFSAASHSQALLVRTTAVAVCVNDVVGLFHSSFHSSGWANKWFVRDTDGGGGRSTATSARRGRRLTGGPRGTDPSRRRRDAGRGAGRRTHTTHASPRDKNTLSG